MPFQVTCAPDDDCILASLSGDLTTEVVTAFFTEVLKVAAESGCSRVLSDLREARIVASAGDLYWMADALTKRDVQALTRRAIVVAQDQDDYGFWETLCTNRGHRNVRVFEDYDEAKRWAVEPT